MDAQHALKGRQKLEELRRKKAAALSGNAAQGELEAMLTQIQNLEEKLQMVEAERDLLRRQREESLVQNMSLADDLNRARAQASQEEKTVATLRKSLDNVTMERDAAFVSREDMVAQLRLVKRRLQEAEEEQYRAEEDAAALRAEIKLLQASEDQSENLAAMAEQHRNAEQQNSTLQKELQELMLRLQQEQHRGSMERQRIVNLTTQNQELQNDLLNTKRKVSELEESLQTCSVTIPLTDLSLVDCATSMEGPMMDKDLMLVNEKAKEDIAINEVKLRELASMVERQEHGRQTLLAEIDKQSLEIERLFVENEGLRGSLKETSDAASRWEAQVQDCLQQNSELRAVLNELRLEQSSMVAGPDNQTAVNTGTSNGVAPVSNGNVSKIESWQDERFKLKGDLARALTRSEELNARVAQQSAELNRAFQALTSLNSLYKPVLSGIENRLLQIRQENPNAMFS